MALALDDTQMQQLMAAAALVPVSSRDAFLRSVAGRLVVVRNPISNSDLADAITFVLNTRGVATSMFMCDAAAK